MRRIALVIAFTLAVSQLSVAAGAADMRYRVCLDPGHGGTDPGAIRGTLVEKELTLDIAQRVTGQLDATQYIVTLTRTDNATTLGNSARAVICNAAGAQVVLSIHLNASSDSTPDYFWAFYGKPTKDKALAATIDQHYRITKPDSAELLPHKAITNFANGTLLKSNAPAALAECLFMSNTREQELLVATDATSRRQQIANELAKGIVAFARP